MLNISLYEQEAIRKCNKERIPFIIKIGLYLETDIKMRAKHFKENLLKNTAKLVKDISNF